MILLAQWYSPESPIRRIELQQTRERNERQGLFSKHLFVNGQTRRWTYGDLLSVAADECRGEIVVLANTDIEFDETIRLLEPVSGPKKLFALTRWETPSSPSMMGHLADWRFFSGTQDAWVFVGGEIPIPDDLFGIPLGVVGCENAFLGSMVLAGCEVHNPAIDVKARHIQAEKSPPPTNSIGGTFAYPELTTMSLTGLVLRHQWPLPPGCVAVVEDTRGGSRLLAAESSPGVSVSESGSPPKYPEWHQ